MTDNKIYPTSTTEAAKMMGIHPTDEDNSIGAPPEPPLPILDAFPREDHTQVEAPAKYSSALNLAKTVLPYMAVFAVGIFIYFFFFTKVDFGSIFKLGNTTSQSVQNTALLNLEKQNATAYQTWVKSFYYDVSDPAVLDPNRDNSGNGLSNFQKYLLNLNPKSYDTLGLGLADSEALAQGINPNSSLPLNNNQKQILSQYFDMETVMNKLALNKMNGTAGTGRVAGAQVFGTTPASASSSNNPVITSNQVITPSQFISPNQPDPNAVNANSLDINTNVPGRLQIPSLKVDAPLIFSQSTDNFDKDLLNGVIHYPGTAMPGQIGTTYISGHSSNYPWVKSNFNHIFTHLGDLAVNQSFSITVTLNSGKTATLHYVVTNSQQYSATDQAQFANGGKSVVALSTCWPVGSTAKRLVVFGELTQVEQ